MGVPPQPVRQSIDLPAIISTGVYPAIMAINMPWGKLSLELQSFPTICAVSKRNYDSSNISFSSVRNSRASPTVINSMNSTSSSRSSSSCMTILIILHHHFGVVIPARITKFGNQLTYMGSNQFHAFVVNRASAICASPSPPLLPYHKVRRAALFIRTSPASRYTSAFACEQDTSGV